jgi:glycosyltransferase involved in cell wall biosynthesis
VNQSKRRDDVNGIRLALFFTRGLSLRIWDQIGILQREIALYKQLQRKGVEVSFVTYGDITELSYADRVPGIQILCNRWKLPSRLYQLLVPFLHCRALKDCHAIKTNQTHGAEIALLSAILWRKPLIARCGYLWSLNAAREHGLNSQVARQARLIEALVFRAARRIVVTTPQIAESISKSVSGVQERISITPNYVDTDLFRPLGDNHEKDVDLIYVGRLSLQKNIDSLLKGIRCLEISLLLIGRGPLEEDLKRDFTDLNGFVRWQGIVTNTELPSFLNRAKIFVLPSHYEGHPKSLIEAMACGLPVVGADSPGIREVIQHGKTGLLCSTDPDSIRAAVLRLLNDPPLREQLGLNARKCALTNWALSQVVQTEFNLLKEVAGE